MAHGIECLVIDPGSLEVKRRSRRVKTDRVDLKKLLRTLSAWVSGNREISRSTARSKAAGPRREGEEP